MFGGIAGRFGRSQGFLGVLPRLTLTCQLILKFVGGIFGGLRAILGLTDAVLPSFCFGAQYIGCIAFAAEGLESLVLCELGVADLGLQVADHGIGFAQ